MEIKELVDLLPEDYEKILWKESDPEKKGYKKSIRPPCIAIVLSLRQPFSGRCKPVCDSKKYRKYKWYRIDKIIYPVQRLDSMAYIKDETKWNHSL